MRTIEVVPTAESSSNAARANSRRALLRTLARVSFAATPVALLMLGPATASAQEDRRDWRDFFDTHDGQGPPARQDSGQQDRGVRGAAALLSLVPVGSVNGGTGGGDFGANNPGGDGLRSGMLGISGGDGDRRVFVEVRGATANASYAVQFVRLNDHAREDLGSITTGDRGEFSGAAPNALGGDQRVGTFILARNGQDQYVTAFA